jgi:hypothetical protein
MIAWCKTIVGPQLVRVLACRDGVAKVHRVDVQMSADKRVLVTVQKIGNIFSVTSRALRWIDA